jgi:phospholipid/cholesterol/gamma-HCH transport system substrate-binding protein
MLRTLNTTNENIAIISSDLRKITQKINSSKTLWKLLSDSVIAADIKQVAINIKKASHNAAVAGNEFVEMTRSVKNGDGLAGMVIADTVLSNKLRRSLSDIQIASSQAAIMATSLNEMVGKLKKGDGTAGTLLSDSIMLENLNKTFKNIEEGTAKFNENMEAMREHFLFKGYFKKQEKERKKTKSK